MPDAEPHLSLRIGTQTENKQTQTMQRNLMSNNRHARLLFLFRTSTLLVALCFGPTYGWCGAKTHVDKGPVKARTFSFLPAKQGGISDDVKQAHAFVQQALIKNLAAKGLTNSATGGEVTVAYLIIAGNNAATTSLNEYFGYSDDSDALVQKVHKQQTGKDNRAYFEKGTLVIDVLDPKTSKVLQRRSIEAQLMRNLPAEQRSARMQKIVDQALAKLPIAP